MKTLIVAILGLALLTGCTSTPRQIEISAKPITKPQLVLPPADELRLKDLTWVVINEENGFLIERRNVNDLIRKMEKIILNKELVFTCL